MTDPTLAYAHRIEFDLEVTFSTEVWPGQLSTVHDLFRDLKRLALEIRDEDPLLVATHSGLSYDDDDPSVISLLVAFVGAIPAGPERDQLRDRIYMRFEEHGETATSMHTDVADVYVTVSVGMPTSELDGDLDAHIAMLQAHRDRLRPEE